MTETPRNVGRYVLTGIAIAMIAGAVALFVVAGQTYPADEHHGSALDGLDGLGTIFALAIGAGGLLLGMTGVAVLLHASGRRDRAATPSRAPAPSLPAARARQVDRPRD